jgi:hypothetical protein
MSGDDDVISGEIETLIALVTGGVSEKYTTSGPRGGQFVSSLCGEIGIANTTENVQVLIWGCGIVKSNIRVGGVDCLARKAIQQVHNSVECFNPVASRHRGLKQQRAEHIIDGAKRTLDIIILWRCVWVGHPQDNPTGGKECTGGGIVELTTIVTLDSFDGAVKLRGNKCDFFDNVGKMSDLMRKGKVNKKWEWSSRITK